MYSSPCKYPISNKYSLELPRLVIALQFQNVLHPKPNVEQTCLSDKEKD